MSLILNIDTATEQASVSLAFEGNVLDQRVNRQQKDHAAWIHVAVEGLLRKAAHKMSDLKAIAVTAGPGSYTGLRVGMATAKGLSYALNIPLLALNTLEVMAYATAKNVSSTVLLCPMLDARRMEVFTALYDTDLKELLPPCAMILETGSFAEWLQKTQIVFFGSGSNKWKPLLTHDNAIFKDLFYQPGDISFLSYRLFVASNFTSLACSVPIYLKDFHTHHKKG
jgi:tRNA threonylcarbamoyladenosine biosynthesis protein TsaB